MVYRNIATRLSVAELIASIAFGFAFGFAACVAAFATFTALNIILAEL